MQQVQNAPPTQANAINANMFVYPTMFRLESSPKNVSSIVKSSANLESSIAVIDLIAVSARAGEPATIACSASLTILLISASDMLTANAFMMPSVNYP